MSTLLCSVYRVLFLFIKRTSERPLERFKQRLDDYQRGISPRNFYTEWEAGKMSWGAFGFEILPVHLYRVEFTLQLSLLLSICRVKGRKWEAQNYKGSSARQSSTRSCYCVPSFIFSVTLQGGGVCILLVRAESQEFFVKVTWCIWATGL